MSSADPAAPRVPPRADVDRDPDVRRLLAGWGIPAESPTPHVFAILANNAQLLARWDSLQHCLLVGGTIPPRDRELLILRTALNCRSAYIWGRHVAHHAPEAGLAPDDIAHVIAGGDSTGGDGFEGALLNAADELHESSDITSTTWSTLAERYDRPQLVELPVLVGEYHLMSFAVNALRVPIEPGEPQLPAWTPHPA